MLALLRRNPAARLLFLARCLSVWGDTFYAMAAIWTTHQLSGSVWQMSLIAVAEVVPYLLCSPFSGVLADRWNRRRLRVWLDLIQGLAVALIPALYLAGSFRPWQLPLVGFLIATCGTLAGPAVTAYLAGVMEREDLPAISGLLFFASRSGSIIVPLLLGIFSLQLDMVGAFLIDAASFFISAYLFWRLPPESAAARGGGQQQPMNLWSGLKRGVQLLRVRRVLLLLVLSCSFASMVRSPIYRFVLPIVASGHLQAGEGGYRLLQFGNGLGGVLGAMLVRMAIRGGGHYARTTLLAWGLSGVGVILLGLGPIWLGPTGMLVALFGVLTSGLGAPMAYSAVNVFLQSDLPPEHVGKVSGLFAMVDVAGDYGGLILMPFLMHWLSAEVILVVGGTLLVLFCLISYRRLGLVGSRGRLAG